MALILGSSSCGSGDGSTDSSTEVVTKTTSAVPVETQPEADGAIPVVVDTDLAADDIVALTYLLSNPAVDVLAVTVAGTGEVTCPRGADVANGLLSTLGHDDVPVACGQSAPLSGDRVFPEEWRTAADNAYGLPLPVVEPSTELEHHEVLLTDRRFRTGTGDAAHARPAHQRRPGVRCRTRSRRQSRRSSDNGRSGRRCRQRAAGRRRQPVGCEWNLYIDPAASDVVISSGAPITLVALDATNQVPVTSEFIDQSQRTSRRTRPALVTEILRASSPPYLWDVLGGHRRGRACTRAGHPTPDYRGHRGEDGRPNIEQADGSAVLVAGPPDAMAVLDHLLRTLVGVDSDDELVTPTTLPVIGQATLSFDGTTCTYDGPTSLPEGMLRLTVTPGPVPYIGVVAHLVEGATPEEALAWQTENPGEQPPMVDSAQAVGEDALPSPATVALTAGTERGRVHHPRPPHHRRRAITVNGGS